MTEASYDIAVIGAGIAGASIASELAAHRSLAICEAEDTPGYHATGRSAAFWEECYGGPEIVPLTLASGPFLRENGFLTRRGALYIARDEDDSAVEAFMSRFAGSGVSIERLGRSELAGMVPGLRPNWTQAIWQPACADIDVAALHQHYLALAKQRGAALQCRAQLTRARRQEGVWCLTMADGTQLRAAVLVNAAGAWADPVADIAGARPLGIGPLRRTVTQLRTDPAPPADMPLVLDISGHFYFKPEAGRLWLSPHDETPTPAGDAAPEELAVAMAVDRFEQVVDWRVAAVERRWAGLRSFAPDRRPVYGFDPQCEGFFWFAGQGGYGIQTAPAAARLAAQLLLDLPRDGVTDTLDAALYAPGRRSLAEDGGESG